MKWTINYNEDKKLIRVLNEGEFNAADVQQLVDELRSLPFWNPELPLLVDNRKMDYGVYGVEEIKAASKFHIANDASLGRGKIALLMKSPADFGLGRQYEMLTDEEVSANVHVFLDEKQALRWLLA